VTRSLACLPILLAAVTAAAGSLVSYRIDGDAIRQPLSGQPGDPERGYAMASNRDNGGCVLCHALPGVDPAVSGNLAPSLDGIGKRLSESQLRLRLVDSSRLNPQTIMPSYYRTTGLQQVAEPYRGKPILTAQQIEDIIAYLQTLK
jgi:sulfur-oxidizing protein SoxX